MLTSLLIFLPMAGALFVWIVPWPTARAAGGAALLVALLWGIVAAVLAARGRKEVKDANPQLPTTQQTLKEDVEWARTQKS